MKTSQGIFDPPPSENMADMAEKRKEVFLRTDRGGMPAGGPDTCLICFSWWGRMGSTKAAMFDIPEFKRSAKPSSSPNVSWHFKSSQGEAGIKDSCDEEETNSLWSKTEQLWESMHLKRLKGRNENYCLFNW